MVKEYTEPAPTAPLEPLGTNGHGGPRRANGHAPLSDNARVIMEKRE